MTGTTRAPRDPGWVYLDTNVLIDLADVFNGWRPPPEPDNSDRQRIAAARIFFYGYQGRSDWYPVVSAEGRRELTACGAPDWTLPMFLDVDETSDAPSPDVTAERAAQFRSTIPSLKEPDSLHLARADLRPWIGYFVSNDRKLRNAAGRAGLRAGLEVIDAPEAEARLGIQPGERPSLAPANGSPLAQDLWWIP